MTESTSSQILDDVFGIAGLVNCETKEEYTTRFKELKEEWDDLEEKETGKDPKFTKYFQTYKLEEIWNHCTPKVLTH